MQEKLAITVLVIMLALFALVLVLYNLVKSKGESYNQIVLSHQDYESRTIPYKRGKDVYKRQNGMCRFRGRKKGGSFITCKWV